MKRTLTQGALAAIVTAAIAGSPAVAQKQTPAPSAATSLYACPTHANIWSSWAGTCPMCHAVLAKQAPNTQPSAGRVWPECTMLAPAKRGSAKLETLRFYACPKHSVVRATWAGACPMCGSALATLDPGTQAQTGPYCPMRMTMAPPQEGTQKAQVAQFYGCVAHPGIWSTWAGACRMCGMNLMKLGSDSQATTTACCPMCAMAVPPQPAAGTPPAQGQSPTPPQTHQQVGPPIRCGCGGCNY